MLLYAIQTHCPAPLTPPPPPPAYGQIFYETRISGSMRPELQLITYKLLWTILTCSRGHKHLEVYKTYYNQVYVQEMLAIEFEGKIV